MADQLLVNIIRVPAVGTLAAGASATIPHGLKVAGVGVQPNQYIPWQATNIIVNSADTTNVFFQNNDTSAGFAFFRVEYDHSIHAVGAGPLYWRGISASQAALGAVWGQFSDNTNQNLSNTEIDLKYNTVDGGSGGITIVTDPVTGRDSRLTVAAAGTYAFTISPQLNHFGGGGAELVRFYGVTNAGTVANSAAYCQLSNNNTGTLPYVELILPMTAGGWFQWWMASSPGTSIRIQAIPAAAPTPAAPSIIAGVKLIGA
jgi:hypothetical protein